MSYLKCYSKRIVIKLGRNSWDIDTFSRKQKQKENDAHVMHLYTFACNLLIS